MKKGLGKISLLQAGLEGGSVRMPLVNFCSSPAKLPELSLELSLPNQFMRPNVYEHIFKGFTALDDP
jgi:hypothetical protein